MKHENFQFVTTKTLKSCAGKLILIQTKKTIQTKVRNHSLEYNELEALEKFFKRLEIQYLPKPSFGFLSTQIQTVRFDSLAQKKFFFSWDFN